MPGSNSSRNYRLIIALWVFVVVDVIVALSGSMEMIMFISTKMADGGRKNLPQGVIMILVVSLLILIHKGNVAHAQGNEHDVHTERADLSDNRNPENQSRARGYALFYRVIVENNLFRPLGWQMPRREPKYVLIATLLESHGEMAKALLMENASKQTYYVTTGEQIGKATVEKIESRQVRLNISGQILTLKILSAQFLNAKASSSQSRTQSGPAISITAPQQSRGNQINRNQKRRNLPDNVEKIVDRYRHGTEEERRKIAEEFERRQQRR